MHNNAGVTEAAWRLRDVMSWAVRVLRREPVMKARFLACVVLAAAVAAVGCGDSSGDNGGGSGGSGAVGGAGGSGGAGGAGGTGGIEPKNCDELPDTSSYIVPDAPPTTDGDCDIKLSPTGTDDQEQIIEEITFAGPNYTICLEAGAWDMGATVLINGDTPGLTLKGIGESPDAVVLDYADDQGNCRGEKGIDVLGVDNVRIENLWVKNTCENAIEQRNTTGSRFVKVMVSWDGEPKTENGAYGIYPTDCTDTVVEYCQAQGASDAGIYIGKCTDGEVRNNVVYQNVAGLEVENCDGVDAYDNEIFDNTGGLFALQQDISTTDMQSNTNVRLYDNLVYCNNRDSFAKPGSAVAGIPPGSGVICLAGDGVEIDGNEINSNKTLSVAIVSNVWNCQVNPPTDCPGDEGYTAGYDPYAKNVYVHDNAYVNNGYDPDSDYVVLFAALTGGEPIEEVIWDGNLEEGMTAAEAGICLGASEEEAASFRDLTTNQCQDVEGVDAWGFCAIANSSTDNTDHLCTPE
jgi:parallel beta-helix repeat protein